MDGEALIAQIAGATGLPTDWVQDELKQILHKMGVDPKQTNLNDLREALASFMQDVLLDAKKNLAAND